MNIYTRGGDSGETELPDGTRVAKNTPRVEVCGALDELNSLLGLVRAESLPEAVDQLLQRLQHELFAMGAELAAARATASEAGGDTAGQLDSSHVAALEEAIDRYQAALRPLAGFILPAGPRSAAGLHVARAVCRRAERRLVTLAGEPDANVPPVLMAYLNRLSDLLFILARTVCARAGGGDVLWCKDA